MTDYRDLPKINALHTQQLQIIEAIEMLDDNGSLSNLTIAPRPAQPDSVLNPTTLVLPRVPVSIAVTSPLTDALRDTLRGWLIQQLSDITMELADLGVTGSPTL